MTQMSMLPWTTGVSGDGAAPYTQENSNDFFRYFDVRDPADEGVALGVLSELAVSGSSSPLTVAPGAAVCYGRYWNDADVPLTVTTPTVGTTGGRVVLRCTWATRQIRLAVKMSTNGIGAIPSLTQSFGNTWEISLATFTITTGGVITLTDDRAFRKATFQVDTAALASNAVTTDKIAALNVTNGKIADDAVDDTKVGNRVPQFYRRQGGSATNWDTAGTTTHTPGAVRMQGGKISLGNINSGADYLVTVTFPTPFSQPPLVIATAEPGNIVPIVVVVYSQTASQVTFSAYNVGPSNSITTEIAWLAIGPE